MNLKFSAFIILSTLVVSCSQPVKTAKDLIVLDLSQDLTVESKLTLSQMASDISYIKLESNPECLIGRIEQYSISKNYILIYDLRQPKILLFNRQGKFLRSISHNGSGPGEYFRPYDVRITKDEKYVLISDMKKVIRFGFDGKLVGETRLPGAAWKIDTFEGGIIGFFTSSYSPLVENYGIIFFDWDGKATGKLLRRNWDNLKISMTVRGKVFYYINDELRINEGYFDTVYAIRSNRSIEPRIIFKDPHGKVEWTMADPNFHLETWMETPDYLFLNGPYKSRLHLMYMDKKTGLLYHLPFNIDLHTAGIPNDLDGGAPFWPHRYQDGSIYRIQEANTLKSVLDNPLIDKAVFTNHALRDKMLAFRKNLSDDDGPVLIEVKLKF